MIRLPRLPLVWKANEVSAMKLAEALTERKAL